MSWGAPSIDMVVLEHRGVVTLGQRRAFALQPAPGVSLLELAHAAALASVGDASPEGRLLAALARRQDMPGGSTLAHTAHRHLSGADVDGHAYRKGDRPAVEDWLDAAHSHLPGWFDERVDEYAAEGDESWIVVDADRALGLVRWRDDLRPGVRACCAALRAEGIATALMYDGDVTTGASLAVHAGIDHVVVPADERLAQQHIALCARTRPATCGWLYLGDALDKATASLVGARQRWGRGGWGRLTMR
ncbi:high-affinity K+ transport system ATPase subunit B [Luteibacter sp. Sphag1AF]|uniref:HAD family hydrolase n=1 Tax=Luteibacter sp. Sphag1AF TaxID=2587031 RepID=UPI00160AFF55|nr:HAD family hydrolase [Luteibacter sp. Sphag1AF]MBB3228334.1 high-affinity K+ transport system ATPase subunit B [Luteibacter sp. Sphag1AF]